MRLNAELRAIYDGAKAQMPAGYLDALAQGTDALRASGILEQTIRSGDPLPPFDLPDQDESPVRSADLLSQGPLVVNFFRGAWCPFCTAELKALRGIADDVRALGARLVAISPQLPSKSRETIARHGLSFDILHDRGNAYADKLGLAFTLTPRLQEIHTDLGGHLPSWNGDDSWRLPMPARLVVGGDGTIHSAAIDPDYTRRPEPADTLAELRRLLGAAAPA